MSFLSILLTTIVIPVWIIILVGSAFHTWLYWKYKVPIFDWNAETGIKHITHDTNKQIGTSPEGKPEPHYIWAKRTDTYKQTHTSWKVNRIVLEFAGIFIGWNLLTFSVYHFLTSKVNGLMDLENLWNLILAFIIGLVGFFGRMPSVIESVQDWFKRK